MRVVAALGGNALLERGQRPDAQVQIRNIRHAVEALAPIARDHELVISHGNGPQVGLLATESATDSALSRPYPLDDLVAETQGMIGYWLARELHNTGIDAPVVALVTQTVVDAGDPAFGRPTKFVGPVLDQAQADRLAAERGWAMALDGTAWRRVVASPEPLGFVETPSIATLLATGVVVICVGGGGAAVTEAEDGRLSGIEAVVDKDLTSALLARELGADALLLLTDVGAVMRDWGTDHASAIAELDVEQLAGASFAAGSMGPKVEACRRFASGGRGFGAIGRLADAVRLLDGTAGTRVADRRVVAVGARA